MGHDAGKQLHIVEVTNAAAQKLFIDLAYRLNAGDPHWVAPLRAEVKEFLDPAKNPFFEHADVALFLAKSDNIIVGRISAHIDHLAIKQPASQGMGPGTGNWGMLEAENEKIAAALINHAENWLKEKGMHRVLAPLSLSIWDEPGFLTKGQDHSPTVMMGHHPLKYSQWTEQLGYHHAKELRTWEVDITTDFPPLIERIVKSGEKSSRINIRRVDKSNFDKEAALIMEILNDAWSDNWGFVPLSASEIAYVGKKLRQIVYEDLVMIAEVEGRPVAFMITLPDVNEAIKPLNGKLLPFGWAKMLWWLRKPQVRTMRVPLMGVIKELQSSRLASQLAFMMIETIRKQAITKYGATRGEIGWILDDNQGMNAIAEAIQGSVNRTYTIYQKSL